MIKSSGLILDPEKTQILEDYEDYIFVVYGTRQQTPKTLEPQNCVQDTQLFTRAAQ